MTRAEFVEMLDAHLRAHGVKCPACGADKITPGHPVMEIVLTESTLRAIERSRFGDCESVIIATAVCETCGYVLRFAQGALGRIVRATAS